MSEIYCFHGLGASKNSFRAISNFLSASHEVCAIDFCGFGSRTLQKFSGDPIDFSTSEIFDQLKNKNDLIFIAHSMGSATALGIANKIPKRLKAVIIIEGNLIAEDCGYLSRQIAQENNKKALLNLKANLVREMSVSRYEGWRDWAKDIMNVMPETLRLYSQSLVKKSDSGELLDIFKNLDCKKLYIYGDEYIKHPVIDKLAGIKVSYIEGAGHFVMTDKPEECFKAISSALKEL